jgi:hypothetical protein
MTVTTVGQSLWRKESVWIAVGKKGQAVVVQAAYMRWILMRVILIIHLYTDECYKQVHIFTCVQLGYNQIQRQTLPVLLCCPLLFTFVGMNWRERESYACKKCIVFQMAFSVVLAEIVGHRITSLELLV